MLLAEIILCNSNGSYNIFLFSCPECSPLKQNLLHLSRELIRRSTLILTLNEISFLLFCCSRTSPLEKERFYSDISLSFILKLDLVIPIFIIFVTWTDCSWLLWHENPKFSVEWIVEEAFFNSFLYICPSVEWKIFSEHELTDVCFSPWNLAVRKFKSEESMNVDCFSLFLHSNCVFLLRLINSTFKWYFCLFVWFLGVLTSDETVIRTFSLLKKNLRLVFYERHAHRKCTIRLFPREGPRCAENSLKKNGSDLLTKRLMIVIRDTWKAL